jgi:hypothetical protein
MPSALQNGNARLVSSSVDESDADAAESLPEADVKLELHTCLNSMKVMRQLDPDRSILGDFGATVLSAQEKGEFVGNRWFVQPQANHWRISTRPPLAGSGAAANCPLP